MVKEHQTHKVVYTAEQIALIKYDCKKQLQRQKISYEAKQARYAKMLQAKNNTVILNATQEYVDRLQAEMQNLVKQTLEFQ